MDAPDPLDEALKRQDYNAALPLVREELRRHPQYRPFQILYAQILNRTGRIDQAERYLRRLEAERPEDIEVQLELAVSIGGRGEFDRAEQILVRVFERSPSNLRAHDTLAYLKHRSASEANEFGSSEEILNVSDPVERAAALASHYSRRFRAKKALRTLREATRAYGEDIRLTQAEAWVFLRKRNYAEATRLLLRAFDLDPSNRRSIMLAGAILQGLRNYEASLRWYRRLLMEGAWEVPARKAMVPPLIGLGRLEEAEFHVKRLEALVPFTYTACMARVNLIRRTLGIVAALRYLFARSREIDKRAIHAAAKSREALKDRG